MAEETVTVDGHTHALPDPFIVIATQNPVDQHGTYPLPEAQMDRFAMRLSVRYPDPADEVGMLVSPELQCAYGQYYDAANAVGLALYRSTWRGYIKRLRNHPSIFDWAMCNEYGPNSEGRFEGHFISIADDLFADAKSLDPSRLVIATDGTFNWAPGKYNSPLLEFKSVGFDTRNSTLDNPTKYSINGTPLVPIISHETGNYNSFPRLADSIGRFLNVSNIKPFWLTPALANVTALGLLGENDLWANASEKLSLICWKLDIEDHRHNPQISGYEWWLIQVNPKIALASLS